MKQSFIAIYLFAIYIILNINTSSVYAHPANTIPNTLALSSKHDNKFNISDILFGGKLGNDTTQFYLQYDGLLQVTPEYNFVDGAWVGQKFTLYKNLNKGKSIKISPYIYYTWGRNKIIYGTDINLIYAPQRRGKLRISFGSITEDFNPDGITRFDNAISSLVSRKSDNYFYLKNYISLQNDFELFNGFTLSAGIEMAKRTGQKNHANWGLWGNPHKIKPNIFASDRFDLTAYNINLTYTPQQKYAIQSGNKIYQNPAYPTFKICYNEGFSSWQTNNSKFRKLSGSISQYIPLNKQNSVSYSMKAGSFLGARTKIHFTDRHHFNTSDMTSISKWPFQTYLLLGNYEASTTSYWLDGNLNFGSSYFLLTRIPFLKKFYLTENLHAKTLYTPQMEFYSELGYSIDFKHLFNIGAYFSFHNGKYQSSGIRVSYIVKDILKKIL